MIRLNIESYCNDCEFFEPEVSRIFADYKIREQYIGCRYQERCKTIYKEMKKDFENNVKK